MNPEGKYVLDLTESFNQICLQNLLCSAEKAVLENEGKFELKQCFAKVTLNGKAKWDPPAEKDVMGLFVLGDAPTGILKFDFTLDPALLKETEKQIKKLTEAGDMTQVAQIRLNQSMPAEVITENTMFKVMSSDQGSINYYNMLIERYKEEDEPNMLELIINQSNENSIWFS